VHALFVSTSAIDCLGRFVSEMTYYVSSGTLNLTKPKPKLKSTHDHLCRKPSITDGCVLPERSSRLFGNKVWTTPKMLNHPKHIRLATSSV